MPGDSALAARVARQRGERAAQGLLRTLQPPNGLDFSSNDYLGLARDPRVAAAFAAAALREGSGSTGSRLLRGDRAAFTAVERRFADFKRTERALFFSSGYLANVGLITALTESGDVVFSDAYNHASLIDGCRLSRARTVVVPHNDMAALERALASTTADGLRFVVVESLYSMDGDSCPLPRCAALCETYGATLIVDEAHAVGVYGRRGSGLLEAQGLDPNRCLSINTAGKAFGVGGAFVAGPAWAIEHLVQRARTFIFSTAAPPAMAAALEASLDIVEREPATRERLLAHSRALRRRLRDGGLAVDDTDSHIIPILIGDNDRAVSLAQALQTRGFDVRAIRPPTVPDGTARLRISVNASLTMEELWRFADAVAAVVQPTGAPAGA